MRFCVVYGFIYFLEVLIIMKKQNDNLESVFVVRVYDVNDVLLPSLFLFRSRAGAIACVKELVPKYSRFEILEVQLDD